MVALESASSVEATAPESSATVEPSTAKSAAVEASTPKTATMSAAPTLSKEWCGQADQDKRRN